MCPVCSPERRRVFLWLALLAACGATAPAATISDPGNELAGWVYIDRNNDGHLAFDNEVSPEWVIINAEVKLYQVTDAGEALLTTALTDATGRFKFSGLSAGVYTLRQTQPVGYLDGVDTLGEVRSRSGELVTAGVLPGQVGDDAFEEIQLLGGVIADHYCFGERGMLPGYVSKRYLLGTSPPMTTAQLIPEPAALGLATLGLMLSVAKRKKRSHARQSVDAFR